MDMIPNDPKKPFDSRKFVRVLLIVLLLLLCSIEFRALIRDFRGTYQSGERNFTYQNGKIVRVPDKLSPFDVEPWMTFSYINFIFKLPPSYLQNTLSLSAPQYPNIQMSRYARMNHQDGTVLLKNVRQAVAAYRP